MCGRFAQFSPDKIKDIFNIAEDKSGDLPFNYNVAPTQTVMAVVQESTRKIIPVRWELVTIWSKGKHYSLINIRDDTLRQKDTFDENFRNNRCIIPADGFYEWKKNGIKVPYFIRLKNGEPMAFAGIFNVLEGNVTSAIVTTRANPLLEIVHDRMPVILPENRWDEWLDNKIFDRESLLAMLMPYPENGLEAYQVTPEVNSSKNNKPEYIVRMGEMLK